MREIVINNHEGTLTVSSLQIAEHFKKEHNHVLRDIENLTAQNWTVKNMFLETTYINERGREYRCYEITRDGFCLLVMGFTGKKALDWKLRYIDAFNQMEQQLRNSQMNLENIISMTVTATLKALMPVLNQSAGVSEAAEPLTETAPKRKRIQNRHHSIIDHLEPELKTEVDGILTAGVRTYAELQEFLLERGVSISIASIGRYSKNLMQNSKQKGE